MKTLVLYKEVGETPLECVKRFVELNPEFKNTKLGYAGRLDPMAKGLILILVGDENKNKVKYEKLNKEYKFEVIFGIGTDSYDILGIPNQSCFKTPPNNFDELIDKNIKNFIGKQKQNIPVFSARRYRGKPLFKHARENTYIEEIALVKDIEVYELKILNLEYKNITDLKSEILFRINKITGNFRQEIIKNSWEKVFENSAKSKIETILVAKLLTKCSSGTYVRSICNDLGKLLGTEATIFEIERTQIGDFNTTTDLRTEQL